MHPQSLCAVRHFTRLSSHSEAVDAGGIGTDKSFFFWKKPENPKFEPNAGIKMAQVLESPLYDAILVFMQGLIMRINCMKSMVDTTVSR